MVPRDAVAIVRSMYAAFSGLAQGGDIAGYVAEHYEPDAQYEPVEETGTVRGHDALVRWIQRWLEAWDETWDEIDEIIQVGEMVVAAIRSHGRGRISGMEISQRAFDVFELRGGRIVRLREYLDPHQALEAAGYHPGYYGAFVLDPDGNNVEVVNHNRPATG